MENELISKKELLELTGISYGQLYRWKRKGLIPEDWFIKKSSYTGQETFFPRSRVLTRIAKIKNMKEDVSLDDLADVFSPDSGALTLSPDEAITRGIATSETLRLYLEDIGAMETLGFSELLHASLFSKLLVSGSVSLDEGRKVLGVLRTAEAQSPAAPPDIYLIRKLGMFSCFAVSPPAAVCLDSDTRLVERIGMQALIEDLKCKLI